MAEARQRPWLYRRALRSHGAGPGRHLKSGRKRVIVESILLGLAIILSVVWFAAPYLVRDYINRSLSGLPDYTGRVESVRIHPWTASLDIYDVHLDKANGKVPVSFFFSPRWTISLQWSEIFQGVERASVTLFSPQVNLVTGPNSEESQIYISMVWLEAIKALIPWRVNQIAIRQGDVHFLDFHADPRVDLEISSVEIEADNISNSARLNIPLPATVRVRARALATGTLEMNLAADFDQQFATFTQSFRMEHVPAVGVDATVEKYLKVQVRSGEMALYSEMASDRGRYHGYVKGFFYRMEFSPKRADKGNAGALWSGVLNTAKGLLEGDRQVIATQSQVSGRIDQPHIDATSAMTGALWSAYIEALRPGFDLNHRPTNPSDTVTGSSSVSSKDRAVAAPTGKP